MKKLSLIIFGFLPLTTFAQGVEEKDSIVVVQSAIVVDSLVLKDTVKSELVSLPSDLDYIPADETPELIADRLGCLQQTIELSYNSKVHAFIDYFTVRDRDYTKMVLRRRDLYFPLFEKKLREYNLPDELKYLSIIESGLNPRAMSVARAVGLWQFMSGTGKYFGLHSDWFLDDRMDPEKATDAACRYLSQLYAIFHNWHLALAAYNSGPGTVRWAVRRSGYKKTFWEIYPFLPRETRSYVPQYIAIIYAVNYADEHNIHEDQREEILPYDTISLNRFLHLDTFARLTGTCVEDLQMLNPHFKRNAVPEDGKLRAIKVPKSAKEVLTQNRKIILDSAAAGKKELETLAKTTNVPVLFSAVELPVEVTEPAKLAAEPIVLEMKRTPILAIKPLAAHDLLRQPHQPAILYFNPSHRLRRTAAAHDTKNSKLTQPFTVKNAALTLDRSCGLTKLCS